MGGYIFNGAVSMTCSRQRYIGRWFLTLMILEHIHKSVSPSTHSSIPPPLPGRCYIHIHSFPLFFYPPPLAVFNYQLMVGISHCQMQTVIKTFKKCMCMSCYDHRLCLVNICRSVCVCDVVVTLHVWQREESGCIFCMPCFGKVIVSKDWHGLYLQVFK